VSTRLYVAANGMGPMNKGSSGSAATGSINEPRCTLPFSHSVYSLPPSLLQELVVDVAVVTSFRHADLS